MPKRTDIDHAVRDRIASWTRWTYRRYQHQYPTQVAFARALGLSQPTVVNVMNGQRSPGLEVLIRLHRRFHIPADLILDTDPPIDETASPPAPTPPAPSPGPTRASSVTAALGRRRTTGGLH